MKVSVGSCLDTLGISIFFTDRRLSICGHLSASQYESLTLAATLSPRLHCIGAGRSGSCVVLECDSCFVSVRVHFFSESV